MKNKVTNLMKKWSWVGLVGLVTLPLLLGYAQPPPPTAPAASQADLPAPPAVSPTVAEVVRLAESGVGEDVIMAYIQNSPGAFDLSADQILYVKDVGLSSQVITAMLNRDAALRSQPQPPATQPLPGPPPSAVPTVPVEAPLTPQTEVSSPPVQANYFYSDLSPYGTWVDLEGFGWCWQPSAVVINRGWRPYCDGGHWVYTDAGWYWQSEYSWGWAPFHYGRWYAHPRAGWVWTPDTVWAPAWVTWRSSGDYCGWAPLPPHAVFDVGVGWRFNGVRVGLNFDFGLRADHFTFVGLRDFNERDFNHRRLAPVEVTKIYNRTTIINNYTVNNNTIVNHGIAVDRVSAVARTPIRRATVREAPVDSIRTVATTRAVEKEGTVVYRSPLRAPARSAPVTVQKVDERHPVIRHTPSIPVVGERRAGFDRGARAPVTTAPSTGIRRTQPEVPRGSPKEIAPRQNVERSVAPTPTPSQPTPRERESDTRREPAPRSFQAPPSTSQPAVTAPLTPTRGQQNSKQAERSTPTYRPEVAAPTAPVVQAPNRGRAAEAKPDSAGAERSARSYSAPPESRGGNAHTYYPKSYHQAEETRSAPARELRQSAPSQSQPGNSQGSKSKKGD
jgi:hypothetical protein